MRHILPFIPISLATIICAVFVFCAPETHIWRITITMLVAAIAFFIVGMRIFPYNFTLAGDAFIAGGVMLMLCLVEQGYRWLWTLLLVIPATDAFRFLYLRPEAKGQNEKQKQNNTYLLGEICLMGIVVTSVIFNFYTISFINILCVILSCALFALGIYIMSNDNFRTLYSKEVLLPPIFSAIPIALVVWMKNEDVTTGDIVYFVAMAVLIVIVLCLDRKRVSVEEN